MPVLLDADLHPLECPCLSAKLAPLIKETPTLEAIVAWACGRDLPCGLSDLAARYAEVSAGVPDLFALPAEAAILTKLVAPLRHVKVNYMLGNFLGAIAQCGIVAEMVAILLWQIGDEAAKRKHKGRTELAVFEAFSQSERVKILSRCGLIDQETRGAFTVIREMRDKYLHRWSHPHAKAASDAVKAFGAATKVVHAALAPVDMKEGIVYLNPRLLAYLSERGAVLEDSDAS